MKAKLLPALLGALVASSPLAFADDGARLARTISSSGGIVGSPVYEGEHAFVNMMNFYVPAQDASGDTDITIEYCTIDQAQTANDCTDGLISLEVAKPLLSFFIYGPVTTFDDFSQSGFPGHGRRDAFIAVSTDDGNTWKRTNVSNTGDDSSFVVSTPILDPAEPYLWYAEEEADGPQLTAASWEDLQGSRFGALTVAGTLDVNRTEQVTIRNAVTGDKLFKFREDGTFEVTETVRRGEPCIIQAEVNRTLGNRVVVDGVDPETCVGQPNNYITDYPGDVTNGTFAVAGNRVLAAWQSKFCRAGFPGFTGGTTDADTIAAYLGISNEVDLYLRDLFVVGGSQGSVDYREQEEFAGEYDGVGEVPFNCLWAARGVLREDPDDLETTELVLFQAERLTSGRRDVNRIEVGCIDGAGCAVTWQEDPEGLRPGEGEGPGTGWAGATTNSQTDVWYSFVHWDDFDIVDNNGTFEPIADLSDTTLGTNRPQPAVPMMVPVRLTNNARCNIPVTNLEETYCNDAIAAPYLIPNQCVDTVDIPLGPNDELQPVCVADTNRSGVGDLGDTPNVANTASSRPRLGLQPRDSDGDGLADDAWVISFSEEDKGLGRFGFDTTVAWTPTNPPTGDVAVFCGDPDVDREDDCVEADIGKNIKWHTFAMGTPQTSVVLSGDSAAAASDVDFSLVNNLVVQGAQLNQPEVNWRTGTFYPPMSTADMWDFTDTYNYLIFNNEIARRSSLMTQSVAKATTNATSGIVAFPLWKQGTVRQGGPADIMARRIVVDPAAVDQANENPYAFANLACEYTNDDGAVVEGVMFFTDGENPLYPEGLCMAPAINLSARTPYECETAGSSLADGVCPGLAMECDEVAGYGQLCSADDPVVSLDSLENPENIQVFDKLLSYYECPGWDGTDVSNLGGADVVPGACGTEEESVILGSNLNDQSWYMPLEVSKAHRGFLDGDFVMTMYAWSPNWKDNREGRDRYELYARRSFDGGVTWTTTPSDGLASDGVTAYAGAGTTTCETWRDGETSADDSHICTEYAAGDPEQSRNMSQLQSMQFTVLDPRYTPTRAGVPDTAPDWADDWLLFTPIDPTDIRHPGRFFIVYEDGDNTTVSVGEAEPLDLAYGRGEVFGDHYTVWSEIDTGFSSIDDCYPNNTYGDLTVSWAEGTGFCNEFDGLEQKRDDKSEEASVTSSAYGDFLYAVWGQFTVEDELETESDAIFRRIWYYDDYIPECDGCAYDVVGQGQ